MNKTNSGEIAVFIHAHNDVCQQYPHLTLKTDDINIIVKKAIAQNFQLRA